MSAPVLVVDDEPAIRSVIAMILHAEGYDVAVAATGPEALACIAQQQPAMILLDLQMPGMSGWQLYDRLRQLDPAPPVVFMTAARRAQQEAVAHQAAGYLAKPFDVDAVVEAVARFIPNPAP
jgi:CheY-like chemotaxis protein